MCRSVNRVPHDCNCHPLGSQVGIYWLRYTYTLSFPQLVFEWVCEVDKFIVIHTDRKQEYWYFLLLIEGRAITLVEECSLWHWKLRSLKGALSGVAVWVEMNYAVTVGVWESCFDSESLSKCPAEKRIATSNSKAEITWTKRK